MGYTNITVNQGTNSAIYTDNTGGTGGTQIGVVKIDISGQGTAGTLWSGNTNISSGTVQIGTIGTLGLGTITGNLGTIGTLGLGTITGNLGTIGTLGLGSVVVNSLPNLPQGSINVTAGTIGTILSIGTLPNLPQGSINVTAGTIGTVGNVGTLNGGTVQINHIPVSKVTSFGTMGTQGSGTTFFTIQGTVGAGTEALVSDWSMVVMAGTCGVSLSFGTNGGAFVQGTGVIGAGSFPAGGGLMGVADPANHSGTNGAIYAGLYGAGTAYFKVSYQTVATIV